MKHLLQKILPRQRRQFWIAIGLCIGAGLIALIWDQKSSGESQASARPEPESVEDAATYIPDGFVLVPIEVANFESLDSILGKFGVVDLFVEFVEVDARPSIANVKLYVSDVAECEV